MNKMPLPGKARASAVTASTPIPPPDGGGDGPEESGETCKVSITSDDLSKLQNGEKVSVTSDDGETVEISMGEDSGSAAPEEGM